MAAHRPRAGGQRDALVVYNAAAPNVEDQKRAPHRSFRLGEHFVTLEQRWKNDGLNRH